MEAKRHRKSPGFKAFKKNIKGYIKGENISDSTLSDIKAAYLSDPEIAKEIKVFLSILFDKFTKKNKTEALQKVTHLIETLKVDAKSDQEQQETPEKNLSTEIITTSGEEKPENKTDEEVKINAKCENEENCEKEKKCKREKKCKWKEGMMEMKGKHMGEWRHKHMGEWKHKHRGEWKHKKDKMKEATSEEESRSKSKSVEKKEFDVLDALFEDIPVKNKSHSRFILGDQPKFFADVDFIFYDKPVAELNGQDFKNLELEICSFLNTRGGKIFFGINADRVVVGDKSPLSSFQKVALKIALLVVDGFYPALQPKHIKIDVLPVRDSESHHLLRIDVQRGEKYKLYCTQKGKYFYRKDGVLTKYSPQEVQEIISANAIEVEKKAGKKESESSESSSSDEESAERCHKRRHWGKHFKEMFGRWHKHHRHHKHHKEHTDDEGHKEHKHKWGHHFGHFGHPMMHPFHPFGGFRGHFGPHMMHHGPHMMHSGPHMMHHGPHMMHRHSSPFHHRHSSPSHGHHSHPEWTHHHSYPLTERKPECCPFKFPGSK